MRNRDPRCQPWRLSAILAAALCVLAVCYPCLIQAGDPVDPPVRIVRPDVYVTNPASQPDTPKATSPMERLAQPTTQPMPIGPIARGPATQPATRPDTTAKVPMPSRAYLRLKLGFNEGAEKDLLTLVKSDKTKLDASVALAELYRRTGRYELAGKTLDAVAAQGEKSSTWRCEKAELLAVLGKYEEALKLAEAVLAEDAARQAVRELAQKQLEAIAPVPPAAAEAVLVTGKTDLHARWLAGQQLETLGRTEDAIKLYKLVEEVYGKNPPGDAANRTWAGLIMDRYSRLTRQQAIYGVRIMQDFFQVASEDLDRQYWPARLAAARLALANGKTDMGRGDLNETLRINPNVTEAFVAAGRTFLEEYNFDMVDRLIGQARKVNPNDPDTIELEAGLHMAERKYSEAADSARVGLKINPRHVGLLGVLAAACLRQGDQAQVDALTKQAEAINPKPAEFFATMAEWQAAGRQYDSAEKLFKKALELAPWDVGPANSLGMMYMQTGQEDLARRVLAAALDVDRTNERTNGTHKLLLKLGEFEKLVSDHFIIRYDRSAEPVIGPYFRDYMESVYAEVTRDYDVQLDHKVIIEVFPKHEDFSMRVTGRSWIPTVGACTGWVVALYSPHDLVDKKNPQTGEPMGFNWARVLRHEFTHAVTLAATGNRIPHWYTEALAVSQESRGNPPQWKWVAMLSQALRQNQLFTVDKIDWGFIRPRPRSNDREMAYAQSQWMAQFIIDRYGFPKINELLKAFRDYKTQARAFKDVLGLTEAEFDKAFREWATQYVVQEWHLPADKIPTVAEAEKAAKAKPQDAKAQADLAVAYLYAGKAKEAAFLARGDAKSAEAASKADYQKAQAAAKAALAIDDKQIKALEVMGLVLEKSDWAQAKEFLVRAADLDATLANPPRLLAQHAVREEQWDLAILWFKRLKGAQPNDPVSYDGLAAIYLQQGKDADAVPELVELANREQSNPVYAKQVARIYASMNQHEQAVYWLNEALHFNPFDATTHDRMARSYLALQQRDKGINELLIAIQLKPGVESYWSALAFAYNANKMTEEARKAAEVAVKLRPDSPARELLGLPPANKPEGTGPVKPTRTPAKSQPDDGNIFFE